MILLNPTQLSRSNCSCWGDESNSLDIEDLEDVRLIGSFLLATMNSYDLVARFAEAKILGGLNDELDEVVSALEGGDLVSNHTARGIKLLDNGHRDTAGEDGNGRSVLSNVSSNLAGVSQNNDQVNIKVQHSRDSS